MAKNAYQWLRFCTFDSSRHCPVHQARLPNSNIDPSRALLDHPEPIESALTLTCTSAHLQNKPERDLKCTEDTKAVS